MKFDTETHKLVQELSKHRVGVIHHETLKRTIIDYINHDNEEAIKRYGSAANGPTAAVAPTAIARDTCGDGTDAYVLESPNIKWATFPVTYAVNPANSGLDAQTTIGAIDASFQYYNDLQNDTVFTKTTDTNTAQITVQFAPIDGALGTVAYCNYSWNDRYEIVSAEIVIDSAEKWFVSDVQRCGFFGDAFDIQNVLTHEIGHGVGLAHCPTDLLSTMYPTVQTGETLRRTFSTGDALGFHSIYGPSKPVYPDESAYGPIILNGKYNAPYQILAVQNVGNVAFRTDFINAVINAGYGRTRASWFLHYNAPINTWTKVVTPP